MTIAARISRLGEHVVRGATLLGWYYRTRPEALRFLAAPALAAVLAMLLAVAWGSASVMVLVAVVVVGSFAVFAVPFIGEIRALEKVAADLDQGPVPWLAGAAEEEPELSGALRALEGEEPSSAAGVAVAEVSLSVFPAVSDEPAYEPNLDESSPLAGIAKEEPESPGEARAAEAEATPSAVEIAVAAEVGLPGRPTVPGAPAYELLELTAGGRVALQTGADFVELCDVAFELIEQRDPDRLEIERVTDEERETVWSYSRSESTAQPEQPEHPLPASDHPPPTLTELFGFDPTRWVGPANTHPPHKP